MADNRKIVFASPRLARSLQVMQRLGQIPPEDEVEVMASGLLSGDDRQIVITDEKHLEPPVIPWVRPTPRPDPEPEPIGPRSNASLRPPSEPRSHVRLRGPVSLLWTDGDPPYDQDR